MEMLNAILYGMFEIENTVGYCMNISIAAVLPKATVCLLLEANLQCQSV